jgi:hypothetical protein
LPSVIYFSWDIYRDPPPQNKFKYQSWYLTPCCGLEVWKPTLALNSVKDPGNIFDWSPKWARTLPSLIYVLWDIYRDLPSIIFFSNIKVDIWHPAVGLRCGNPPWHLNQLKTRPYRWLKPQVGKNFAVLGIFFMGYLYRPPPQNKIQISKLIFDTLLWAWGAETHRGTSVN